MIERLLKLASILENTEASVEDLLDCYVMISTAASKNEPNDPELWNRAKAAAKKKFKVYPCVPIDNSKALTVEGWKKYNELSVGDLIFTYNIKNDTLEVQPILALNFFENAPVKCIYKKTGFFIEATENHMWVVSRKSSPEKRVLLPTSEINSSMRIWNNASLDNENHENIFEFSKKQNWTETIINMSKVQREAFLASAIVYDGHEVGFSNKIYKRASFGFSQKNKDHFFAAITAAVLNGYHVNTSRKSETMMSASIIRNKRYHSTKNLIIEDSRSCDVWCPTTPNKTWVMMQNGFVTITGNSAYANAWAAKWYKEKGGTWRKKKKSKAEDQENAVHEDSGLGKWFNKEKWVDISRKDKSGKHPECGRSKAKSSKYPKCRPKAEADRMSKKEKESATRQKRDAERKNPKKGKGNKPTMESHKKRD